MKKLNISASLLFLAASATTINAQSYVSAVVGTPAQGLRSDGISPVAANRSVVSSIFGAPEGTDSGTDKFYSLGFGGEIVLQMGTPICNVAGNDLTIFETSFGNPSCNSFREKARVWASQDLCNWVELTTEASPICLNASLDLGVLSWARYIRIKDVSNPLHFGTTGDGYDIDGIVGASGCTIPPSSGTATIGASGSIPSQGTNENGGMIPANRSIAARMHGLPTNPFNFFANDVATSAANNNFFSLGKNGSVILSFPVTLFNGPGADLKVFETSFNDKASSSCGSYPEKAKVEGSVDGSTWFDLTILPGDAGNGEVVGSNIICRDGILDFNGNPYVNFIKITDVTFVGGGNFPGVGDGFDVDAVIGLHDCNKGARLEESSTETDNGMDVFEDAVLIETFPNPVADVLTISGVTSSEGTVTIRINDMLGRILHNEVMNNADNQFIRTIDMNGFSTGVYTVSVETANGSTVTRVVKK
jgi:hypothetical protein